MGSFTNFVYVSYNVPAHSLVISIRYFVLPLHVVLYGRAVTSPIQCSAEVVIVDHLY